MVGAAKVEDGTGDLVGPGANPDSADPTGSQPAEAKKDIQNDIDKSVCEILALSSATSTEVVTEQRAPLQSSDIPSAVQGGSAASRATSACQPSIQQLELLELEMRARAIKALMKASKGKKPSAAKNV